MGAQDENKAEPQNEFLSGFKIKPRTPSTEREEKSFVNNEKGNSTNPVSQRMKTGLQHSSGTNLSQFKEQVSINNHDDNILTETNKVGFVKKIKERIFSEESDSGGAKQKVMVVLIPVLFVVMVFMYRQVLTQSPQNSQGALEDDSAMPPVKKVSGNDIDWKIPEVIQVKTAEPKNQNNKNVIRNNIVPEEISEDDANDSGLMNVKSILYSDDKPSVVINNKIVYINQEINGVIVREIHKDYIIFEKDGATWKQKVSNESFQEEKSEINMEDIN